MSSVVAGSAVYVYSVHVYPQSRDLNQIQSTLSNFTIPSKCFASFGDANCLLVLPSGEMYCLTCRTGREVLFFSFRSEHTCCF